MSKKIVDFQEKVLKALAGRIDDFYLVGGTALSLYYLKHRVSQDLDFFTRKFSRKRIDEIVKYLSCVLKKNIILKAEQDAEGFARVAVYSIPISRRDSLKVDFVEDYLGLVKPPKDINGINVASLEDICIKKIYTITGAFAIEDSAGRKIAQGSREEAKDFFDLYCLSHVFLRLSEFSFKYGNSVMREGIVRWFRTYSRLDMKTGLLELALKKAIDYNDMERHFKKEIARIIEKEIEA